MGLNDQVDLHAAIGRIDQGIGQFQIREIVGCPNNLTIPWYGRNFLKKPIPQGRAASMVAQNDTAACHGFLRCDTVRMNIDKTIL
jgi:hypothetical protein